MSLRLKLLAPLFVFALTLVIYLYGVWMPKAARFHADGHYSSALKGVGEGLVPLLLDNRLANIYDNLNMVLTSNGDWVELHLYNEEGLQLYPLQDVHKLPDESPSLRVYEQSIQLNSDSLGRVVLVADTSLRTQEMRRQLHGLLGVLSLILAVFVVAIAIILERIIRKPLKELAVASKRLGDGDFHAALPSAADDEMGVLIDSFTAMRNAIQKKDREINQARDMALQLAQSKSEFLANMSHEIRTPLNGVMGTLELLQKTRTDERQSEYLRLALQSSEILTELLNDVLDLSKIEAGKVELESIDFQVRQTVDEIIELFSSKARDKGLVINATYLSDVPPRLNGDPGRLRQVLSNLIGNAVKFTEAGEINVNVTRLEGDEYRTVLGFSVCDTGIGIPGYKLGSIFEPFQQADGSMARRYGGTGLGLSLCKHLVELMGGSLTVSSVEGRGSEFSFSVGFEAPNVAEDKPLFPQQHVLVYTPDAGIRTVLENHLRDLGTVHELAYDISAAKARLVEASLAERPYDIVISDEACAQRGWYELGRLIKQDSRIAKVNHWLIKRNTDVMDASYGLFDRILYCPVSYTQLQRYLSPAHGVGTEPVLGPVGIPGHAGHILLVEDNKINQRVTKDMLNSLGYEVDIAESGLEALDALNDVAAYDAILMDCHMPLLDGFETTREIRRLETDERHIPIIALTADAMEGDRERCIVAGMDDYMMKPVSIDSLRKRLVRWVG